MVRLVQGRCGFRLICASAIDGRWICAFRMDGKKRDGYSGRKFMLSDAVSASPILSTFLAVCLQWALWLICWRSVLRARWRVSGFCVVCACWLHARASNSLHATSFSFLLVPVVPCILCLVPVLPTFWKELVWLVGFYPFQPLLLVAKGSWGELRGCPG